jgi:hypothetical protein
MSGGASGLTGYIYQQRYLAFQVLASVAAGNLPGYPAQLKIKEFAVEGRDEPDAPAWDVRFLLEDDSVHLRECKDTAITKTDRAIFYRRIRQELQAGTAASRLTVGWVTDPDKQGNILDHFAGMAALAASQPLAVPANCPDQVRSDRAALEEAIYCLCSPPTKDEPAPALSLNDAKDILSRLSVERHRMSDLGDAVRLLAEGVFEGGTGEAIDRYIQGEFSVTITRDKKARYTVTAFLEAVNVGTVALQTPGPMAALLRFNSGVASGPEIPDVCWVRLPGAPRKLWSLQERLGETSLPACLLTASIGGGKTVTSLQAFASERTRRNGHHVLRVAARDLDKENTDALLKLACVLCGLAPTWLSADGLDEVRRDRREEWSLLTRRLLCLPGLTSVLTARQEVVAAHPWLQEIGLPERPLDRLTEAQVSEEFRCVSLPVPANRSLLDVLRTPLLFSLYARVVTPEDMPLAESGEVTAFGVIEAFWRRTVLQASVGHRSPGDGDRSQHPKRLAAEHMVLQTLEGNTLLRPGSCSAVVAEGYETLRREGVITSPGTHAYRWAHDWIREYAIIDYLVSTTDNQTLDWLLDEIATIPVEHVGRTAAVAGVKWLIAHSDWGQPQAYLLRLWERNKGYARDVLVVLVEEDARHLVLDQLPAALLAELIDQARLLRAWQWRDKVAALPDAKFLEDEGRMQSVATAYELEVVK